MLNRVTLIGNLGRDPESKQTATDKHLCTMSLATTFGEKTEWHRVKAWGKQADYAAAHLVKGSLVLVEGRNETSSWEDKDTGKKLYSTDVIVHQISRLGGKVPFVSGDSEKTAEPADESPDDIPF